MVTSGDGSDNLGAARSYELLAEEWNRRQR